MSIRHLILILGDQLNEDSPALKGFDLSQDRVLIIEASGEATHVWSHKARILLFLAAMRHRAKMLIDCGYQIIYLKLGEHNFANFANFANLADAWAHYIQTLNPQKVIVCEPGEYRIEQLLIGVCKTQNTTLVIREDIHFMCSKVDFNHWTAGKKQLRMEFFYRVMRKKYNVLMHSNEPIGKAWNYDAENRKPFSKTGPQNLPTPPRVSTDVILEEVKEIVAQLFPHHPGSLEHFIWPVTRGAALEFLDDFIANKLSSFGDHQDAMWQAQNGAENPYLWHSLLSTSLNLKLLNPREVIAAAEAAYLQGKVSLANAEGFIRQILGWREFIRGMYWLDMPKMADVNHYNHTNKLPAWYWTGDTHMNCMRQTISQTFVFGYAHHIQRLMITGMFGVLSEINPREISAWYLAAYVDAVEWVELPNVVGMALYANGGRFTSKPYIASGAYIKRMSNYCAGCKYKPEVKTGSQACPFTTLYWNFLIKHYDSFSNNPRTALMMSHLGKLDQVQVMAVQEYAQILFKNLEDL